jgi:hypothetical protein
MLDQRINRYDYIILNFTTQGEQLPFQAFHLLLKMFANHFNNPPTVRFFHLGIDLTGYWLAFIACNKGCRIESEEAARLLLIPYKGTCKRKLYRISSNDLIRQRIHVSAAHADAKNRAELA